MNQFRKTTGTNPKTLQIMPERKEIAGVFTGSAGKTVNGTIFLLGLGFCFFQVKFYSVSFFYRECPFGANADAKTHAVTELFR